MSATRDRKERQLRRIFNSVSILYEMCDELKTEMEQTDAQGQINISEHDKPVYAEIGKLHSELEERMDAIAALVDEQQ